MTGLPGAPYYSNLYFFLVTTQPEAQAAADAVRAFWLAQAPSIGVGLLMTVEPEVALIDEATGNLTGVFTTVTAAVGGGAAGDRLPPADQGLGRLLTGGFVDGRRVRGRIFMPAMVEANSTLGAPIAAYTASLSASLATLMNDPATGLTVWARPRPADPLHVPPLPLRPGSQHAVTGVGASTQWAVLRSRRD